MKRLLVMTLGLALGLTACFREPITETHVNEWHLQWNAMSKDSLTVGDPFHIILSGSLPAGSRLLDSGWGSQRPEFAVRKASNVKERNLGDSLTYYTQDVELAAFQTGRLRLGPVPVSYLLGADTLTLWSDTLSISIASVIIDSQQVADLRDIKPPYPLQKSRLWWFIAGGLLVIAAIIITILLRRRRGELSASGRPVLPPLEEFKEGFVKLQAGRFPEKGEWGLFTLRLSRLVRRYIERRFKAPVLEMTTQEIRRWTEGERLDLKLERCLLTWLGKGDQIKFAGVVPTLAECGTLMDEGHEIVIKMHEMTDTKTEEIGSRADGVVIVGGKKGS